MDSDSRKFLIIGGVAVVILVIIFIYTLSKVFGPGETPEQGVAPFPESGERTDIAPQGDGDYVPFTSSSTDEYMTGTTTNGIDEDIMHSVPDILRDRGDSDWRDPVVSFSGQDQGVTEPVTTNTGSSGSTYTSEDLFRDTGLTPYYPDPSVFYPQTVTLGDGTTMDLKDALDFDKFNEITNPIPNLTDEFENVQSCGTLQLPTTDSAVQDFLRNLDQYDPVICLGEAVANDCDYAWTKVITADRQNMWVYVGEKEDGTCGVGNTYVEGLVEMCDLTGGMNIATKEENDFETWMEEFKSDPGRMFAKLYTSDSKYTGETNLSCNLYQI